MDRASELLPDSIVVQVTTTYGDPIGGVAMAVAVGPGDGTVNATSAFTDGE